MAKKQEGQEGQKIGLVALRAVTRAGHCWPFSLHPASDVCRARVRALGLPCSRTIRSKRTWPFKTG